MQNNESSPIQQLFESNQFTQAKQQCLIWLKQDPNAHEAWHWLGLIYAKTQEFTEAKLSFQHAISLNPNIAIYHNNISNIYVTLKDTEKAKQHLLQSLKLEPSHSESFNNLGRLYYMECLYSEAISYFEKALRISKDYWESHYNIAHCYTKINQMVKARIHYLEAIRLQQNHEGAHFNLGLIYFESQVFEDAKKCLKKALELNPENGLAAEYLAHTELALGNSIKAMEYFETALQYYPESPALHHNLAILYCRQKDQPKALKHFEQTLKYQPKNATASHMSQALKGVQTSSIAPVEFVRDLFDQYSEYYDQHVKESLKYAVPGLLRGAISESIKGTFNAKRVLDLGCGTGLCGIYFRDLAKELLGIDLSPKMINKAKALGAYDSLEVVEALEYLSRDNLEKFDLIIASDVLVYFGELNTLFKRVASKLNSNGHFVFSTELLEKTEGEDFKEDLKFFLKTTGRFAHHPQYIRSEASAQNLKIILEKNIIPRENEGSPVPGKLFVLGVKATPNP